MKTLLSMLVLLSGLVFLNSCDKDEEELAHVGAYNIRDIGPAGGFIFYINPDYLTDGWRYMEAAPSDLDGKEWGTTNFNIQGANGTAIGTGLQNTIDIINNDPFDSTAADMCANYSYVKDGVTYDDWFLPSRDEIEEVFTNLRLANAGNFPVNEQDEYEAYWSSSQADLDNGWGKCFQTLVTMGGPKDYVLSIRPVRFFQEPDVK